MPVDLEMESILRLFFQESAEGLDAMESGLLSLGSAPDREIINSIFRAAHSVKGGAAMFGLAEIAAFAHHVETLLDQMRDGTVAPSSEAVQLLLQAADVMRDMMNLAQSKQPIASPKADPLTRKLSELLSKSPAAPVPQAAAAAAALSPAAELPHPEESVVGRGWLIEFDPHSSLFTSCNDPLRLFRELAALGTLTVQAKTDTLPAFDGMDPTQCYLGWTLTLEAPVRQAQLAEIFDWVDANSRILYQPLHTDTAAAAGARKPIIDNSTGLPPGDPPPVMTAPAKLATDAGSIRVATEKVDALINLVGELVITQSLLSRFSDHCDPRDVDTLKRGLAHLARNTRDLQESVLKIRMLPISFSFNRFPRLVHELSRRLGKTVELRLSGENTEIDKTVLEKIGDPLVHLVRNALDHGLETPQVRTSAGKSGIGMLELNAFHEGGCVIIEVKDDGAGLNTSKILAKARERGMIDSQASPTDEQIHDLIFQPGFSTAESVSDVSGRGVGMDVVRRNINDLGGHVHISSVYGMGSTVRVRLPLTLAILEGQILRVGREIYVLSLLSIIETVQPKREQIHATPGGSEVFKHRDCYLPVIRLHDLFDIEPQTREISEGLLIVVESDGKRVAILVDELLAQQQVVIKSLETNFKQVPGLAGATIHGDGTVALILDVPGLIELFLGKPSPQMAA